MTYNEFNRRYLPGLIEKERLEMLKKSAAAWGRELARQTMEKAKGGRAG